MAKLAGHRAVVIGAGIAGLAAAAALSRCFDSVVIFENDNLPDGPMARPGVPQSHQLHGLLKGGLNDFEALVPGLTQSLTSAGAFRFQVASDLQWEVPGVERFPQLDLGWSSFSMSRPLFEFVLRKQIGGLSNVNTRDRCRALSIMLNEEGDACGLVYRSESGNIETFFADLVVDASSRGTLTLDALSASGRTKPEELLVGIDMKYCSAVFSGALTSGSPVVITQPKSPDTKWGYVVPIEGNRVMALICERHGKNLPKDHAEFLVLAEQLRTRTISERLENAAPEGKVHRFTFCDNMWRRYEGLVTFCKGLIPIGDAYTKFNPVYGQGMAIAAREAIILRDLLVGGESQKGALWREYFKRAASEVAAAWAMSVMPDFANPMTRGERPETLEASLRFSHALVRLAASDPEIYRVMHETRHLLIPYDEFLKSPLATRIENEAARMHG